MHPIVRLVVQLLGIAHEHLRIQGAIQVYEACSRTFQNDAFTLFRLGTLLGQGQWLQARSCLKEQLKTRLCRGQTYWFFTEYQGQDGHVENFKEMVNRKATELYATAAKICSSPGIK